MADGGGCAPYFAGLLPSDRALVCTYTGHCDRSPIMRAVPSSRSCRGSCETNLWKHLAYGIGLPRALVVVSFLIPAIVFALGVLFVRSFLRRGSFFLAAIAFPFHWVATNF